MMLSHLEDYILYYGTSKGKRVSSKYEGILYNLGQYMSSRSIYHIIISTYIKAVIDGILFHTKRLYSKCRQDNYWLDVFFVSVKI